MCAPRFFQRSALCGSRTSTRSLRPLSISVWATTEPVCPVAPATTYSAMEASSEEVPILRRGRHRAAEFVMPAWSVVDRPGWSAPGSGGAGNEDHLRGRSPGNLLVGLGRPVERKPFDRRMRAQLTGLE